jgi:hypothetical protein
MTSTLKKKNRFGLFFKRRLAITDEPKLYYNRNYKDNDANKFIELTNETRLERLDKVRFKISVGEMNKGIKRDKIFVFRCNDVKECEEWILVISE